MEAAIDDIFAYFPPIGRRTHRDRARGTDAEPPIWTFRAAGYFSSHPSCGRPRSRRQRRRNPKKESVTPSIPKMARSFVSLSSGTIARQQPLFMHLDDDGVYNCHGLGRRKADKFRLWKFDDDLRAHLSFRLLPRKFGSSPPLTIGVFLPRLSSSLFSMYNYTTLYIYLPHIFIIQLKYHLKLIYSYVRIYKIFFITLLT